jgi:hypothetical protein
MRRRGRSALCAVVLVLAAWTVAAGEPRLGSARWLLSFSWYPSDEVSSGVGGMRLSPDGEWLLYARREVSTSLSGQEAESWRLVRLAVADRSKVELPVPPIASESMLKRWLTLNVFHPSKPLMTLPVRVDDGYVAGLFDSASGELRRLGPSSVHVLPGFDSGGGSLVVSAGESPESARVAVIPVDGGSPRQLNGGGLAGPVCPAAPIVPLQLISTSLSGKVSRSLSLVGTSGGATSAAVCQVSGDEEVTQQHWTANGRYLYWGVVTKETGERFTGVWDRAKGRQVAKIDGALPLGTGPGGASMVLAVERSEGQYIVLHDPAKGRQWTVGHAFPNVVTAEGGRVVFIERLDEDEFDIEVATISR